MSETFEGLFCSIQDDFREGVHQAVEIFASLKSVLLSSDIREYFFCPADCFSSGGKGKPLGLFLISRVKDPRLPNVFFSHHFDCR